jgi:hypothetical protein
MALFTTRLESVPFWPQDHSMEILRQESITRLITMPNVILTSHMVRLSAQPPPFMVSGDSRTVGSKQLHQSGAVQFSPNHHIDTEQ